MTIAPFPRLSEEEHLGVPYVLTMVAARSREGHWVCRAAYPELGCEVEAPSPIDAIDMLERRRETLIVERLRRGEHVPVPRPPLAYLATRIRPNP